MSAHNLPAGSSLAQTSRASVATCDAPHANREGDRPETRRRWGGSAIWQRRRCRFNVNSGSGCQGTCTLANPPACLLLHFALPQTHTNTQRCGQQSGCWLLPVGLCSLNCLSDSRLSKFTRRDPARRLPQPLATQREEPVRAHERKPNADGLTGRQELQTMVSAPGAQSAPLGPLAKVLGKWVQLESSSSLRLNFERPSQRSEMVHFLQITRVQSLNSRLWFLMIMFFCGVVT